MPDSLHVIFISKIYMRKFIYYSKSELIFTLLCGMIREEKNELL